MSRGVMIAGMVAALGCQADGYEPGEPWEGPEPDGWASPAMGDDDDDDDGDSVDGDDAPHRDPQPTVEPLTDDAGGDDPGTEPAEPGDEECGGIGFVGKDFTHCDAGETFADGCCWPSYAQACERLACDTECIGITTVPMTATCTPE